MKHDLIEISRKLEESFIKLAKKYPTLNDIDYAE